MMKDNSAKDKIKEAAAALFAIKGFKETSVQEITSQAGVNKALLFYYFHTKDNLYYEIVKEKLKTDFDVLSGLLASYADPVDKLKVLIDLLTETYTSEQKMVFFMPFHESLAQYKELRDSLKKEIDLFLNLIADVFTEGIEKKAFRTIDPILTAKSLMGLLIGFYKAKILFDETIDQRRLKSFLYILFVEGLLL